MVAKESRVNDLAEGFGQEYYKHDQQNEAAKFNGTNPGQGMSVLFKPLSGLLNQNKMLPLRYAPITIELETVDDPGDPFYGPIYGTAGGSIKATNNETELWHIDNVQVKVDTCTLDNAFDNSYAQHLLGGRSLPISYNTFVSQNATHCRARPHPH